MSTPTHRKISNGYVIQEFAGAKCVKQEFVSIHDVSYVDMEGTRLKVDEREHYSKVEEYYPFDMIQPERELPRRRKFIAALRDHLHRDPTEREVTDMMENYMDYLEDFRDPCDIEEIQALYLKHG